MRNVPAVALAVVMAAAAPRLAGAWPVNAVYGLPQDLLVASGGFQSSPGVTLFGSMGVPIGGLNSNAAFTVFSGLVPMRPDRPTPTAGVEVSGTVDDPLATVTITANGTTVQQSGAVFSASFQLPLGPHQITVTATDTVGNRAEATRLVYVDVPAEEKGARFNTTVSGTVADSPNSVTVNGVPATLNVNGVDFTAPVPVVTGHNILCAIARDSAGNATQQEISVFVLPPTQPPAMPTVGTVGPALPQVTTADTITVGGTKRPGTSIWINGQQVHALDDATTWSIDVSLAEGDNVLEVVTRDASGTSSAPARVNIVRDQLPPVVTFTPPARTNLTPVPLQGRVDDSLTQVTINGIADTLSGPDFAISVPLTLGANTLQLHAVSPNGFVTDQAYTITLGRAPIITSMQPVGGAKLRTGAPATLQVSATDADGDPLQMEWQLDGQPITGWVPLGSTSWTPGAAGQTHQLTARVRDGYGGDVETSAEIFIIRAPVEHP